MFSLPIASPFSVETRFRQIGPLCCYIETLKGEIRRGPGWSNVSPADYGYINGFLGADHDEMDCYIGPNSESLLVTVVDQSVIGRPSAFDEHKCMLGYGSPKAALTDYMKGHHKSREILIGAVTMDMGRFLKWLNEGDIYAPISESDLSFLSAASL